MAEVKIVAKVDGISTEHGYIKAWETFEFKGEPRYRLWTIWTQNLNGINENDIIEATGDLSTKANTYLPKNAAEPKTIVEHSLNRVAISNKGQAAKPTTEVTNGADIIDMPF